MSVTFQSAAPVSAPAARGAAPTPRLELRVGTAVARYLALSEALPGTGVRYAVKANPNPCCWRPGCTPGAGFDVASPAEVSAALAAGARPGTSSTPTRSSAATDVVAPPAVSGCSSSTRRARSGRSRRRPRARRCCAGW